MSNTPPQWVRDLDGFSRDQILEQTARECVSLAPDDLLFVTQHTTFRPEEANLASFFARGGPLNCPLISAAMSTVTEWELAVALAREGGLGVIHKAMASDEQAAQVKRVRHKMHGLIRTPHVASPNQSISHLYDQCAQNGDTFRTFPVVDEARKLVGLITGMHFDFFPAATVRDVMAKDVVTLAVGATAEQALATMRERMVKTVPVVGQDGRLEGLYLANDVLRATNRNGTENTDEFGQLRVGAAIGIGEEGLVLAGILAKAGVSGFFMDTAHADNPTAIETIRELCVRYPTIPVIAGNVSTAASAWRLAEAGAKAVKVGQGPGSICTTRVVSGAGKPQWSAVAACAKALSLDFPGVIVIADGGIETSGAAVKLLAAGASALMLGSLFAGTDESPGSVTEHKGVRYKEHRGMASARELAKNVASRQRYYDSDKVPKNSVPEGVEGRVPYRGPLVSLVRELNGGIQSGMRYVGCPTIPDLHTRARFTRVTQAGVRESNVHGLTEVVA